VVYLPALGEGAEAGAAWRMAWAGAGYAVLSLQPLADDAQAWHSVLAREGEFKALGEQRYGADAMRQRVQRLAAVLDEARRHAIAGDPDWQGIAWDRSAVAGSDLGAYTAMVLAGEQIGRDDNLPALVPVRAAIAISPYPGGAAGRYAAVYGPALSITGDADGDALGLVAEPGLRRAPFDAMPASGKYLLLLSGLAHAPLSGNAPRLSVEGELDAIEAAAGDDRRDAPGSHQRRGGNGPASRADRPADPRPVGVGDGGSLSPTAVQLRLTAAQQVSTAFLDAYVKDDPRARGWLLDEAGRWLVGLAQWQHK